MKKALLVSGTLALGLTRFTLARRRLLPGRAGLAVGASSLTVVERLHNLLPDDRLHALGEVHGRLVCRCIREDIVQPLVELVEVRHMYLLLCYRGSTRASCSRLAAGAGESSRGHLVCYVRLRLSDLKSVMVSLCKTLIRRGGCYVRRTVER